MKSFSQKYFWINRGLIILSVVTFISLVLNIYLISKTHHLKAAEEKIELVDNSCSMDIIRENSNKDKLVKPLLLADINSESPRFSDLKVIINKYIGQLKQQGEVKSVSVYLRDLNSTTWTDIGDDDVYYPGSLMKVPILIYYLKQEQDHPGSLKKELLYTRPNATFPIQTYIGDSIISGRNYSIETLLRYMIAESDNRATYVLTTHIDQAIYRQLFSDLDIPYFNVTDQRYTISPRQYSKFFRLLYSSTYLNSDLSNYALNLLTKCNFKSGLVQDLPSNVVVAHKFGERGFDKNEMDFSECGIIYYASQPYLLTIMTRGSNVKQQTAVVRELSAEIFNKFKNI
jgi:beta-lactamase class A